LETNDIPQFYPSQAIVGVWVVAGTTRSPNELRILRAKPGPEMALPMAVESVFNYATDKGERLYYV
jgi:hypothetical protein